MSELDRLVFEDFVLCFFDRAADLGNSYWRTYFLDRYMKAFPENEFTHSFVRLRNGGIEIEFVNYIKEIN